MRRIKIAAIATLVFLSGGSFVSAAETMRIGTEGAYPPFSEIKMDGSVVGFDVDIAFALCKKMQVECSVVTQEWEGIIPALNEKRYDFIAASMSITDERLQEINFTNPYYTNKLSFVGKKDVSLVPTQEGMKGKNIGVQSGTIAVSWLQEHFPLAVVREYENQQKVYADLRSGNLDLILSDTFVSWAWLESDEGKGFEFKGDPVLQDDKIAIGVRKDDAVLQARLNRALQEILEDGTYKAINAKYFPFSIY